MTTALNVQMNIWNIINLNCGKRYDDWSSQLYKPEKKSALNGIRARDLCDTGAVLYQLSYQATWELVTWNWLAKKTTTNRIISREGSIIIQSRRNTFIIRNLYKRKSSLYQVAKFRKHQCKLISVAGRYNSPTLQVCTEYLTDSPGERV